MGINDPFRLILRCTHSLSFRLYSREPSIRRNANVRPTRLPSGLEVRAPRSSDYKKPLEILNIFLIVVAMGVQQFALEPLVDPICYVDNV